MFWCRSFLGWIWWQNKYCMLKPWFEANQTKSIQLKKGESSRIDHLNSGGSSPTAAVVRFASPKGKGKGKGKWGPSDRQSDRHLDSFGKKYKYIYIYKPIVIINLWPKDHVWSQSLKMIENGQNIWSNLIHVFTIKKHVARSSRKGSKGPPALTRQAANAHWLRHDTEKKKKKNTLAIPKGEIYNLIVICFNVCIYIYVKTYQNISTYIKHIKTYRNYILFENAWLSDSHFWRPRLRTASKLEIWSRYLECCSVLIIFEDLRRCLLVAGEAQKHIDHCVMFRKPLCHFSRKDLYSSVNVSWVSAEIGHGAFSI